MFLNRDTFSFIRDKSKFSKTTTCEKEESPIEDLFGKFGVTLDNRELSQYNFKDDAMSFGCI